MPSIERQPDFNIALSLQVCFVTFVGPLLIGVLFYVVVPAINAAAPFVLSFYFGGKRNKRGNHDRSEGY